MTPQVHHSLVAAERLLAEPPPPDTVAAALGNSSTGCDSVSAAVYAVAAHPRFEGA